MPKKKSLVLRMSEEDYQAIKKWAEDDFRSVNSHIEWIIHRALVQRNKTKKNVDKKEP